MEDICFGDALSMLSHCSSLSSNLLAPLATGPSVTVQNSRQATVPVSSSSNCLNSDDVWVPCCAIASLLLHDTHAVHCDSCLSTVATQIDMQHRPDGKHKKMEKYILRKAFDDPSDPYLPESVLWRQKEQFSDGVGYSWVDGLKEYASKVIFPYTHANMHCTVRQHCLQ